MSSRNTASGDSVPKFCQLLHGFSIFAEWVTKWALGFGTFLKICIFSSSSCSTAVIPHIQGLKVWTWVGF